MRTQEEILLSKNSYNTAKTVTLAHKKGAFQNSWMAPSSSNLVL
jgi:hypothetical protein